jgi:hypothetical protein
VLIEIKCSNSPDDFDAEGEENSEESEESEIEEIKHEKEEIKDLRKELTHEISSLSSAMHPKRNMEGLNRQANTARIQLKSPEIHISDKILEDKNDESNSNQLKNPNYKKVLNHDLQSSKVNTSEKLDNVSLNSQLPIRQKSYEITLNQCVNRSWPSKNRP